MEGNFRNRPGWRESPYPQKRSLGAHCAASLPPLSLADATPG